MPVHTAVYFGECSELGMDRARSLSPRRRSRPARHQEDIHKAKRGHTRRRLHIATVLLVIPLVYLGMPPLLPLKHPQRCVSKLLDCRQVLIGFFQRCRFVGGAMGLAGAAADTCTARLGPLELWEGTQPMNVARRKLYDDLGAQLDHSGLMLGAVPALSCI